MQVTFADNEGFELDNNQGILLVEILVAKAMRLGNYRQRCANLGLDFRGFFDLRLVDFHEIQMVGGEHEGRGAVADREVGDDSTVSLTVRGREIAEPVRRVRAIFCDGAPPFVARVSSSVRPRRRRRPQRQRPQQLVLGGLVTS